MTTIIILIAALFCLYKILSGLSAKHKEQEWKRQEAQRQAEAQRMQEEWKRTQEEARLTIQRQEAEWKQAQREREELRKEQERVAREQERQAKEQVRLAKEQERQAAQLEKHEEMLRKHEFQLRQAMRDIEFLNERLAQQNAQRDYLLKVQAEATPGSKEYESAQRKLIVLENQIHTTKNRYNKAVFTAKEAKIKTA